MFNLSYQGLNQKTYIYTGGLEGDTRYFDLASEPR